MVKLFAELPKIRNFESAASAARLLNTMSERNAQLAVVERLNEAWSRCNPLGLYTQI